MKNKIRMTAALMAFGLAQAGAEPTALVQQATVVQQTVSETLTVYGRVEPAPDAVLTISLPHAGLITRVGVRLGQRVKQGDLLLEWTTAPAARMQYIQAQSAVSFARRNLARQQQLLKDQMATKAQVDAASKALDDALSGMAALEAKGQDKTTEMLTAPTDGIVTQLQVKQGDRVQADTAALSIASGKQLVAQLGVEPEDIHLLKPGLPVRLRSVFVADYVADTRLSEIHAMVNPDTHLVDALAPIPPDQAHRLVLGSFLTAELELNAHTGQTVPQSAVLHDEQGRHVFVVANGKAQRVDVETGLSGDSWIEITGGLSAGQSVISVGNHQLTDGMAIREEK